MLQIIVQPNVLNPIYTMVKTFNNVGDKIIIFLCALIVLVIIPLLAYTYMIKKMQKRDKDNNERKYSGILSKASVTDNGIPADKVFKTLEENGIKPNYLGMGDN